MLSCTVRLSLGKQTVVKTEKRRRGEPELQKFPNVCWNNTLSPLEDNDKGADTGKGLLQDLLLRSLEKKNTYAIH